MRAFYAAYQNELDKLLLRKKYIVFLIIGLIICTGWAVIGSFAAGAILNAGGIAINLTPTPMGVLPFFSQVMIPLVTFMGCADLITGEAADNTMKAMIYRPIERRKLYAAKIMAVATYAAAYLLAVFIASTLFNQVLGRTLGAGEILSSVAAYVLTIFPLAVVIAFAAFVALFGRSSTLTMFVLILSYLAMNVLPFVFPILFDMLFTSYLGWHRLWIGVTPPIGRVLHVLAIVGGYGVAFFTAGSLVFDGREY